MSHPERTHLLHEGKAKQVYATSDPHKVWIHFKDSATAFDGAKKAEVADKGEINSRISWHLMGKMGEAGVPTHNDQLIGPRDQLCHNVEIIPVEVVVRNIMAGSWCRRYGQEEGTPLSRPVVEYFYKDDALHDPHIAEEHCLIFGWAESWELAYLKAAALRVNQELLGFWDGLGVDLVDFKLEFGRHHSGAILLADEITPDGSRLWEKGTGRHLDKDVFRRDLGDLSETYRELFQMVFGKELSA